MKEADDSASFMLSSCFDDYRTFASYIRPYKELWSRLNGKRYEFKAGLLGMLLETIMFPLLLVW